MSVTRMCQLAFIALHIGLSGAVHGEPIDFVKQVRPILQQRCYACHGVEKQKSGLRLDIKSAAFQGGDNYGPSIVASNISESPLVELITATDADLRMPPDGESLSAQEMTTLTTWIAEGANWPEGVDLAVLEDRRDHWSFKPLTHPSLPSVRDNAWPRGEIDTFILAQLEQVNLQPAPEADRLTWLRRVSLDLVGLPPTIEQVAAFIEDNRAGAYERVVEELLRSPRYGERWAQHWLDVVRYADTHGFEVNTERPNAWPYRDYVISAFNRDTPYDDFVREQIVGDKLGQDAATGFLITSSVLLPGQIGKDEPSLRLARQDSLDEIVINIGQTFLGLSIGCARCHDHKFDPITAREYYAMQAFVAGVEYAERELRSPEADTLRRREAELKQRVVDIDQQLGRFEPLASVVATVEIVPPPRPAINAQHNSDRFLPVTTKRLRFTINATNRLEPCLDELEVYDTENRNVALATRGTSVTSSGDRVTENRHELRLIHDGVVGNSSSWMSSEVGKGTVIFEFASEQRIERVVWSRDRTGNFSDRLATDYRIEVEVVPNQWQLVAGSVDRRVVDAPENSDAKKLPYQSGLSDAEAQQANLLLREKHIIEEQIAATKNGQVGFAGRFRTPDKIHLLHRGDPEQPKEELRPAVLSVLANLRLLGDSAPDEPMLSLDAPEPDRRVALADWIANPTNPLTPRVMVNRIWQGHFGIGLVDTASDFGRTGTLPSHPELLDWLATKFIESGWSIKQMHRIMVLSATYRQSSQVNQGAATRDADVRLLWCFPSRRLEAETIRDSMLLVSGQLNLTMGGRGFNLFSQRGGLSGFTPVEIFPESGLRRMIYAHKVRREREAVFGAFDCPDAGQSTSRRRESTTPIQALNLFNSKFTLDQAAAFASRVTRRAGTEPEAQILLVFRLALGRVPTDAEWSDTLAVVKEQGLQTLCRVLFNSNEFLFMP